MDKKIATSTPEIDKKALRLADALPKEASEKAIRKLETVKKTKKAIIDEKNTRQTLLGLGNLDTFIFLTTLEKNSYM